LIENEFVTEPVFLKISLYAFGQNSRDQREIEAAYEAGFKNIHVISATGLKELHSDPIWECTEIVLKPFGDTGFRKLLGNISAFINFIKKARALKPKVISGHDIFGLLIGYLSSIGRREQTYLVYDAHEYEMGRFAIKQRNSIIKKLISLVEKFLIKRSSFSIIVNQTILKRMQNDYALNFPYVVVRNIPVNRFIDYQLTNKIRQDWLKKTNLHSEAMLLVYHGIVIPGRGIEMGIRVCSINPKIGLVILGNGNESYINELKEFCELKGVQSRVIFVPAVTGDVLISYIAAGNIGLSLIQPVSLSYYYSLPNKLFEALHAGNPVLGSNFPEIRKVIEEFEVGLTCDPTDVNEVIIALDHFMEPNLMKKLQHNVAMAKKELTWDKEKLTLIEEFKKYRNIIN